MANLPSLGPRGEGWVVIQAILIAVLVLAGFMFPGGSDGLVSDLLAAGGLLLIVGGGALAIAGVSGLQSADAFSALPRPRDEGRLVETGAYRLVRHPVYGGLILGAIGWSLARGSVTAFVAAAALLVFFDLKRRREEAWLSARFPSYVAYGARTRRMIPWIY
jgi:protein-S-isoprenylcysteine O-methyltransferase Ste14